MALVIVHLPPSINHLNITLKVLLKQKSNHCTRFVIAPTESFFILR